MKHLFTFLCVLTLCLALIIPSYASDDSLTENGDAAQSGEVTKESGEVVEESVFEIAYREISRYSAQIFSALAFVFAAILTFSYKKGLLPLISGALKGLAGTVGSIKDESEKGTAMMTESAKLLTDSLAKAENSISDIADKIATLEDKLSSLGEICRGEEEIKRTVMASLEILEEIFMSSSLPVYQKEAISKRMAALKGVTADYAKNTD